jgi:hypothetical protein
MDYDYFGLLEALLRLLIEPRVSTVLGESFRSAPTDSPSFVGMKERRRNDSRGRSASMNYFASGLKPRLRRITGFLSSALLATTSLSLLVPARSSAAILLGAPADSVAATARALRLSFVEGQVQVVQVGQIISDPALVNQPLFEASQVITGNDGRAEIQLEDGGLIRISPNSTLTFSVLRNQGTGTRTEVVLNSGLAYFELQPSNADHNLIVNFGTASFSATSASVIRVTEDTPPGDVAVFSGNIHFERGTELKLDIHGGETVSLGSSDPTQYNFAESIEPDSWDSWNADRDQLLNQEASSQTAATQGLGYNQGAGMNDLDANGSWYNVPGTGYIWSPYDAQIQGAGWDPYGFGHWVYYPRFGYVWVSGYPWGYSPFACGTWNYWDTFGWGWAPGGGCSPWWGFGGWGYNIGTYPRGYRPPRRPEPGPTHPRPAGSRTFARVAVVPVDNRPAGVSTFNGNRPGGDTGIGIARPVVIAGRTVEPLHPIAPRQSYDRSATSYVNRPSNSIYAPPVGSRPVSRPGGSSARPASAPSSHPAASHVSSGGGAHVSAGSGGGGHAGGGGGGSHK